MSNLDLISLSVASVFALLVLALFMLIVYILRVSGEREAELVKHKERLASLLECYAQQLVKITERIAELAAAQAKMEEKLEKIDERLWSRGQPVNVSQSQIGERADVGQAAVGRNLRQKEE